MNILILSDNPPPLGGAEQHILLLEKLYRKKGHNVSFFFFNSEAAKNARKGVPEALRKFVDENKFDAAHIHAIEYYYASCIDVLADKKIPCFVTLHDYRYLCPAGDFCRKGSVCEDCRGGRFYNAAFKGCYSMAGALNRYLHETLLRQDPLNILKIKRFIAPSMFLKRKYEEFGFKGNIEHIFNFIDLEPYKNEMAEDAEEPYILFFGRLMPNKGIMTLADAVKGTGIKLKIAGRGPVAEELQRRIDNDDGLKNISLEGFKSQDELIPLIGRSMLVCVPSECYEVLAFTALEAMAMGKPVIAAKNGGLPDLLSDGRGILFKAGDSSELKEKILMLSENPGLRKKMGEEGRRFVFANMNEDIYYEKIMGLYKS